MIDRPGSGMATAQAGRARYVDYFFVVAIPLVALLAYQVWASYQLDYRAAESQVGNLSLVLEAKLEDVFRSAEFTVDEMVRDVGWRDLREAASPERGAAINAWLQARLSDRHDGLALRYFDAGGRELLGAGAPALDIAGMRFFKTLRAEAAVAMDYSEVLVEPTTGKQRIYLAKPVRDRDGVFLGVAAAGIDLDVILTLIDRVAVSATDVMAMRRLDDGALVFRRPGPPGIDNAPMPECPVVRAVRQGRETGIGEFACGPDRPLRLVGYRAVKGYPFVVYVGLDKRQFLAGWRMDAMVSAGVTVLVLLVIGLVFRSLAQSEDRRLGVEARLRESEKRFRDIVEASGDWVWEVDAEDRYTYASEGVLSLLGRTPEAVLGKTPFDFMPPEEAVRVSAEYAAITARRAPFRDLANLNVHQDGGPRHVESSGMPIFGPDGGLLGYRGLDKDVTARVEAELALQKSQATLSALFQSTPAGIVVTRLSDGHLVDVNETFLAMYGARREEVIGKSTLDLKAWDNPELRTSLIGMVMGHGVVRDFEVVLHDKAGKAGTGSISAALVDLGGEQHIVGVIVDISQRKQLETELKQAKDRTISALTVELERRAIAAEAATHAKSQFLANMSHEFRTPLNAIMGFGQILMRRVQEPESKGMVEKVLASSRQLLAMLNDVLNLVRLDDGGLAIKDEEFRFDDLIRRVADEAAAKAAAKGLAFYVAMAVVPNTLRGDVERLASLLANYLDNAVKFTDAGSVTLASRVVQEGAADLLLRFEVRDTGLGIPAEARARIFEPFEQVDGSSTRRHGGTGLGLAINQRLAHLLGGEVGVDSVPGRGSTFWATVRLARPGPDPETAPDLAGRLRERHGGCRILVVEDEATNRALIADMLSETGLELDMVEDGLAALERVRGQAYDLVLMDLRMPRMDGLAATRAIRALSDRQAMPIVAVTANATEADRQDCLAAGMNDFLAKPVDLNLLMATLLKWLRRPA
jgi:PAS domain S-box-containing protein